MQALPDDEAIPHHTRDRHDHRRAAVDDPFADQQTEVDPVPAGPGEDTGIERRERRVPQVLVQRILIQPDEADPGQARIERAWKQARRLRMDPAQFIQQGQIDPDGTSGHEPLDSSSFLTPRIIGPTQADPPDRPVGR